MRSSTFIAFAIGVAMLAPIGAFAEETTTGTSGGTGTARPGVSGGAGMQFKIITPRDTASGQASGKMMMNASGTPPRPGMKNMMASGTQEKMNERMDAAKERMDERRDDLKTRMMERKSEILKRTAKQAIERLRAAVDRLSKLADRLDSRIAKIKAKGVDTTKETALLATARTQINAAKTAIDTAEKSIAAAIAQADANASSTTPNDAGKPVREALKTAEGALKNAHKALVDAIAALKASAPKEALDGNVSVVATTTASTTVAH